MASTLTQDTAPSGDAEVISPAQQAVRQFMDYPFDEDATFRQGYEGIVSSGAFEGKSPQEREELVLRSKLFFFNRATGSNVTLEDVFRYQGPVVEAPDPVPLEQASSPVVDAETTTSLRVLTFAELTSLIEQGRTDQIPNNKHIPNIINTQPPSISTTTARKKPWENSPQTNVE